MTIYSPSGAVVYEAPITKSAIIRRELMGDYYIELMFDAVDRIDIGRGCYILYNNHRFEIMNNVIPDDTNQGGLRYTLRFESQQSQMKRCNVFWREGGNLEVSFALTSDIATFGQLIVDNVNAFLGGSNFSLGSVPSGTEMKAISFAGDSCWDAVATIAETFGVEWWTEEDGDNVRLCFGKLEIGESVEFKKGDIVSYIPSKKGDDANYGTRFYVFGSTKNLPSDYGSTVEGGVTNNVVEKRLHLPNGQQYIDAWPNLAPEDIIEKTVFFDDVMPTNVETITEVYSGNAEVIPGTSHKVYDVVCANSPFSLDDIIEGETIQANFTSGSLNGQTFDLELTQTSGAFNKTFRIVPKILDKDSLTILPQGEMIPRKGDTFILLNVNLPQGRIEEAEQRLLEVGQEYVKKNSSDTEIYDCPTNAVYCHRNDCNFTLGQRVTLVGEEFGASGRVSRIQGYEKRLYDEYQATYTVGDNSAYSRLASLEKSVQQATYSNRIGLEANIIRSKNDSTKPSDFNVYSALASEDIFLSKRRGGTVKGHTNFEKGLSVFGKPVYDEVKKTWILDGDLLVTGAITMYGLTEGYKPSTIMDAVKVDGNTIIKENGTLKINPNINLGGGSGSGGGISIADVEYYLTTNGYATQSWVTGKGYITSSALEPYALKTAIPTNTNQLTNGAGFITGITGAMVTNALGYTPLSTGGGTITGAGANPLTINRTTLDSVGLLLRSNNIIKGEFGWASASGTYIYNAPSGGLLGIKDDGTPYFKGNTLLHSGNYSDYALPKDGTAVAATTLKTSTGYMYARAFNVDKIVDIGADATFQGYSTYIDGMYIRFRYGSANTTAMQIGTDGNVVIGGTTASDKLHVYGAISSENTNADAGFRARGSTYALFFGIGGGNVNRGIYDDYHKGWWIMRGADKTTTIDGSMVASGLRINQSAFNNGLTLNRTSANAGAGVVFQSNGSLLGQIGINGTKTFEVSDGTTIKASIEIPTGNLLTTGAITMYYSSDKRLKQNIRKANASKALMSLGGVFQYEYIDSEVQKNRTYGGSHFGLIYQNVKGTALDKMCFEREDGMGALNYLDTNFISLIAGATMENISEVEKLKRKIRTLENKVKQLESRA